MHRSIVSMPQIVKLIKTLLGLCALLLIAIAVTISLYCYRHRDEVAQNIIAEASKRLKNTITVGAIALESIQAFPHIVLSLRDVSIHSDQPSCTPWVKAHRVRCTLNLWHFLHGTYTLRQLKLAEGEIDIQNIPSTLFDSPSSQGTLSIRLQELCLENVNIVYREEDKAVNCRIKHIQSSLAWNNAQLSIHAKGRLATPHVQYKHQAWQAAMSPTLEARLTYDTTQQVIALKSATVQQGNAVVEVSGHCGTASHTPMHFQVQSKRWPLATVLPHLPAAEAVSYGSWRSYLSGTLDLRRGAGRRQATSVQGKLVFHNTTCHTARLKSPLLAIAEAVGTLEIADIHDMATASLRVDDVVGALVGNDLQGGIAIQNFQDPQLQCYIKGPLDLVAFNALLGQAPIQDIAGQLSLDLQLKASLRALLEKHPTPFPKLTGTLAMQSVQCIVKATKLSCNDCNGQLVFQDDVLRIPTLAGSIGHGTFSVCGSLEGLLPALLGVPCPLNAQGKLYVDYLDLDAILPAVSHGIDTPTLDLSPRWHATIDCDIQQMHYRRFRGKNIRTQLRISPQKLVLEQCHLGIAGGKASLSGYLHPSGDHYDTHMTTKFRGVDIQQLLYMCENFYQHFLTDEHLHGKLLADGYLDLPLSRQGQVDWKAAQGEVDIQLHDGVLQQFPPIQRLAKYIPREALAQVRFSALRNRIKIKHGVIHIPPMEVHSSITRMLLSGTHALDGRINYRFEVPLAGLNKGVSKQHPEAVAEDVLDDINVFLRLQGTTDQYQVTYDTRALKKSLQQKLKKHGRVIKQILRGKYQQKKKVQELIPDEYLDFD